MLYLNLEAHILGDSHWIHLFRPDVLMRGHSPEWQAATRAASATAGGEYRQEQDQEAQLDFLGDGSQEPSSGTRVPTLAPSGAPLYFGPALQVVSSALWTSRAVADSDAWLTPFSSNEPSTANTSEAQLHTPRKENLGQGSIPGSVCSGDRTGSDQSVRRKGTIREGRS